MENLDQNLAKELLEMAEADKAMRNRADLTDEWDSSVDENNTARLKEIVVASGWPEVSRLGKQAAEAAWLIAQHADHDIVFQQQCLEMMKQLPESEIDKTNLAYLEDRVRVNTGKPQLYGTQFHGEGDTFGPRPIEDEANLDERRESAGLKPFAEYKAEIEEIERQHRAAIASTE